MELTTLHYIYIGFIFLILITLLLKKDIVVPCILGIFAVGLVYTGSIIAAVQTIYNTLIYAGNEFWGIIVIISLVMAMSKGLSEIGADELMIAPIKKLMRNKNTGFFTIGLLMFVVACLIWPSPSVALIGALLLPAAIEIGVPAIWAAVAMNLFGHGMALSGDYFIQGAPTITAKAANVSTKDIMAASAPLWITMSVVTISVAFFLFYKEQKKKPMEKQLTTFESKIEEKVIAKHAKYIAVITPIAYLVDIFVMYKWNLTGGDATALVGGTAILLMLLIALTSFPLVISLEKVVDYLKIGFGFGIKVFAPVIIIGGFFFLGNEGIAKNILGPEATGLLNDISLCLSASTGIGKVSAIFTQVFVAIITGLDGSGFSGLPIVGSLAYTVGNGAGIAPENLAALGQILTIWVGGGTIIPWAVIPVAAICKVNPAELVRKNCIPVLCGIAATIVVAFIIF